MASLPHFRSERGVPGSSEPNVVDPAQEIARYRALVSRAVDAFGDEVKASRWLSLPNRDLNGRSPLQVAQSNGYDIQALEPIFTRIEHGIDY